MENSDVIVEILKMVFISVLSSAITLHIQRIIRKRDKNKKLKIYVKFVGSQFNGKMCRYVDEETLEVPLWIEFVNTTDAPLMCRDIDLYLYSKGVEVDRFHQINQIGESDKKITVANNGKYSFVVPENSIYRLEGEFFTKRNADNLVFDAIFISYNDGNNEVIKYKLIDVVSPWSNSGLKYKTNYWYELKD